MASTLLTVSSEQMATRACGGEMKSVWARVRSGTPAPHVGRSLDARTLTMCSRLKKRQMKAKTSTMSCRPVLSHWYLRRVRRASAESRQMGRRRAPGDLAASLTT